MPLDGSIWEGAQSLDEPGNLPISNPCLRRKDLGDICLFLDWYSLFLFHTGFSVLCNHCFHMRRLYTLVKAAVLSGVPFLSCFAQNQFLVGNGGQFGAANNQVTIGLATFIPGRGVLYHSHDSIPGNAITGSAVSPSKESVAIATDSRIVGYSRAFQLTRVGQIDTVPGVRGLCFINDSTLVATFGFGTPNQSSTIRMYRFPSLVELGRLERVKTWADAPSYSNGKLVVPLPGSFADTTGSLAVVSMPMFRLDTIINLGRNGVNVQKAYKTRNGIWTGVAKWAFGATNSGWYQVVNSNTSITGQTGLATNASFGWYLDSILIHGRRGNVTGVYSFSNVNQGLRLVNSFDAIPRLQSVAGGDLDTTAGMLLLTEANYSTRAKGYLFGNLGAVLLDSILVGVSPEQVLYLGQNPLSASPSVSGSNIPIGSVYPNPASSFVRISLSNHLAFEGDVELISLQNQRIVLPVKDGVLDVSRLSEGLYIVKSSRYHGVQKLLIRR